MGNFVQCCILFSVRFVFVPRVYTCTRTHVRTLRVFCLWFVRVPCESANGLKQLRANGLLTAQGAGQSNQVLAAFAGLCERTCAVCSLYRLSIAISVAQTTARFVFNTQGLLLCLAFGLFVFLLCTHSRALYGFRARTRACVYMARTHAHTHTHAHMHTHTHTHMTHAHTHTAHTHTHVHTHTHTRTHTHTHTHTF
jgi:hypothetical protein